MKMYKTSTYFILFVLAVNAHGQSRAFQLRNLHLIEAKSSVNARPPAIRQASGKERLGSDRTLSEAESKNGAAINFALNSAFSESQNNLPEAINDLQGLFRSRLVDWNRDSRQAFLSVGSGIFFAAVLAGYTTFVESGAVPIATNYLDFYRVSPNGESKLVGSIKNLFDQSDLEVEVLQVAELQGHTEIVFFARGRIYAELSKYLHVGVYLARLGSRLSVKPIWADTVELEDAKIERSLGTSVVEVRYLSNLRGDREHKQVNCGSSDNLRMTNWKCEISDVVLKVR